MNPLSDKPETKSKHVSSTYFSQRRRSHPIRFTKKIYTIGSAALDFENAFSAGIMYATTSQLYGAVKM